MSLSVNAPLPSLLAVTVGLALAAPAAAADPDFALVSATGSADGAHELRCLTGARASGVKVVLFGPDLRVCKSVTRELTERIGGGTCTRVELPAACEPVGLSIAVLGTDRLEGLRVFPRAPRPGPARIAAIASAVERGRLRQVVAARGERWRLPEPVEVAAAPAEAFGFEGLPRGLVFVRYPITQGPRRDPFDGTLLVALGDAVSGPFDVHALTPFAFGSSGRIYLWGGSFAAGTGWRVDQIYAVERGKLRLLHETGGLST